MLAGCHAQERTRAEPLPETGPPNTLRVALDPELGERTINHTVARGGFRLVSRTTARVVVARPGLTIVFRRLDPLTALRAFRRGELDEAPVPQGELRAVEADPVLGQALRARVLQGLDVVVLPATLPRPLLEAYRVTAPRGDYQQLIGERVAPAAYGLRRDAEPTTAADFRRARASIRSLPRIPLRLGVPDRAELVEAAELAWAEWRQLGLPIRLAPGEPRAEARFVRMMLPASTERENVVALGWVVEARLVSPRVRGWGLGARGLVDYTRVRLEPRA